MPRFKHEPDVSAPIPEQLTDDRPKGDQLREILEELARVLPPGELLPSERVLAERYAVARMTVRQEIDHLVAEGLAYRRPGHGTFVAEQRPVRVDLLTSFSQEMRARGQEPGARVLSARTERAGPVLAARLEVPAGSPVLRLHRLRTADGEPMALELASLSADRYPGIEDLDWTDRSLFTTLADRWGVTVGASEVQISAVLPEPDVAGLLDIPPTQPCFRIQGPTRDREGAVIEFGLSHYRGDRYDVLASVHR